MLAAIGRPIAGPTGWYSHTRAPERTTLTSTIAQPPTLRSTACMRRAGGSWLSGCGPTPAAVAACCALIAGHGAGAAAGASARAAARTSADIGSSSYVAEGYHSRLRGITALASPMQVRYICHVDISEKDQYASISSPSTSLAPCLRLVGAPGPPWRWPTRHAAGPRVRTGRPQARAAQADQGRRGGGRRRLCAESRRGLPDAHPARGHGLRAPAAGRRRRQEALRDHA